MSVERSQNQSLATARAMAAVQRAWDDFNATLQVYHANIQRRDYVAAEAERLRLETLLTDYLDHYAIAGKLAHGDTQ